MDYIEGDYEARVNEVSATAVVVALNWLAVCDAVSELAAISFKNTSPVVKETPRAGGSSCSVKLLKLTVDGPRLSAF